MSELMFEMLTISELKEFMGAIPIHILRKPIIDNEKHFAQQIRGFRSNTLPLTKLVQIYHEEIQDLRKGPLEKILISYFQDLFSEINILDLLKKEDAKIDDIYVELKKCLFKNQVAISPLSIFKISVNHSSEEVSDLILNANILIDEIYNITKDSIAKENSAKEEEKEENFKRDFESLENKYRALKAENTSQFETFNKQISTLNAEIEAKDENIAELFSKIKELDSSLSKSEKIVGQLNLERSSSKTQIKRLSDRINELTQVIKADENLRTDLSNCRKEIEDLKSRSLSPDMVFEIGRDVISDLHTSTFNKQQLIEEMSKSFNETTQIDTFWNQLSDREKIKIELIISRMRNETVTPDDIDELDEAENSVYMKFVIIKSLKALFYKYLEQAEFSQSISKIFE